LVDWVVKVRPREFKNGEQKLCHPDQLIFHKAHWKHFLEVDLNNTGMLFTVESRGEVYHYDISIDHEQLPDRRSEPGIASVTGFK
jgi:hypothetical protein